MENLKSPQQRSANIAKSSNTKENIWTPELELFPVLSSTPPMDCVSPISSRPTNIVLQRAPKKKVHKKVLTLNSRRLLFDENEDSKTKEAIKTIRKSLEKSSNKSKSTVKRSRTYLRLKIE